MTDTAPRKDRRTLRSTHMRVRDIMVSSPMTCPPETPIADAARMMSERRVSSILVDSGDEIVGIWTEHDALGHDLEHPEALEIPVSEVMSAPVATISAESTASDAAVRFKQKGYRHFVVLDTNGEPIGLITQSDVVFNHGVEWFMRLQTVDSVLSDEPAIAGPDETTSSVARRLHDSHADAMVVRDPDGGIGILTERDVVRYIAERHKDCPAWEVSSRPLQTVARTDSLFNARNLMMDQGFRHLGVVDANGDLVGLIGFSNIIASIEHGYIEELEHALDERDSELRASEERYRALVELSPDAIAVHRDGTLLFINPAGVRLLGARTQEELIDHSLSGILSYGNGTTIESLISTETGATPRVTRLTPRGDTDTLDVELTARPIQYGGETAWQLILRDITERKRMEDELRRLATTDQLTGICNRPHFESQLDKAISGASRYGERFALIMFDVDRFKSINDELGHDAGDQVLRKVVDCISPRLRDSDVFCRWGGEEFLILARRNDAETATNLAEKLRTSLRDSVKVETIGPVTASFGVTTCCGPDDTRMRLLKRVDDALYEAKRNGRDCVSVTPD